MEDPEEPSELQPTAEVEPEKGKDDGENDQHSLHVPLAWEEGGNRPHENEC